MGFTLITKENISIDIESDLSLMDLKVELANYTFIEVKRKDGVTMAIRSSLVDYIIVN